jgi:mono/diheme cytochrome c family protein
MANSKANIPVIAAPRTHRHLRQGRLRQAVRSQDADPGGRSAHDRAPFFDSHEIKLLWVLTDRGSEYCGNPERHEYELYLAIEDIDHSGKTKSLRTNGICQRFHKTLLNECYQVAFREKLYRSIDELLADLDLWVRDYNEQRPPRPLVLRQDPDVILPNIDRSSPGFLAPITCAFDDSPLDVKPLPNEQITAAVKSDAKKLYLENCRACNVPEGSGHIGPSWIGETHHDPRFATDRGIFEIVYGGVSNAIQPFGGLLTQDQILRVAAYVRTLKKKSTAE